MPRWKRISSSIISRTSGTTSIPRKPMRSASAVSMLRGAAKRRPTPEISEGLPMSSYHLDHLQYLETEAIHIMREVAGEFERPALLFSGGKDSICLLRLAEKAFRPSEFPMPLLNVDTGHHFPELNEFRDRRAKELGAKLIIRTVEDAIAKGIAVVPAGEISRNRLQIPTLLAAIEEFRFDCCIGGARRDEEKARAKERFFSFRDSFGQWDPKNQRPEIWNLYNGRL